MLTAVLAAALSFTLATAQDTSADSPYWHDRYHAFLSMAAYDSAYLTDCANFFTDAGLQQNFPGSTEAPFTIITQFGPTPTHGLTGYAAVVPEMNKTVVVFSGVYGWENFDTTPTSLDVLNVDCPTCTAHAGALTAWLEVKNETDDLSVVQEVESYNGHIWSMTGHGFGAMVAQVAALDLGYRNLAHAVHSFGSPRVFNPDAATLYNKLFQGTSNTRTVANDDYSPGAIPESANYTHVLGGFHVYGSGNSTFGQNYEYCSYSATDPNCLGGDSHPDHWFYYTTPGTCGSSTNTTTYNPSVNEAYEAAESSSYALVSTVPISLNSTSATATSSIASSTAEVTTTQAPSASVGTASASATATSEQQSDASGAVRKVASVSAFALFAVAALFML